MEEQSHSASSKVETSHRADPDSISEALHRWVRRQASEEGLDWLDEQRERIRTGGPKRIFFTSFSAVPRYLGKDDLELSEEDRREAESLRTGWQPEHWSIDQTGRTLVVLSFPRDDANAFIETFEQTFITADVGESVALCQSLPLLPYPDRLQKQAAEGLRSNMTSVFEAVALRNPYPADFFDDAAWNQMVLKAVFVESPLHLIYGLDRRANRKLARMLVDFAHERWAASRPVTPELWRPVGPFAEGEMLDDLKRVLESDDEKEQEAAALALAQSPDERAEQILSEEPELREAVRDGDLTWSAFTQQRLVEQRA